MVDRSGSGSSIEFRFTDEGEAVDPPDPSTIRC